MTCENNLQLLRRQFDFILSYSYRNSLYVNAYSISA
jgi:hypothetical protein